MNPPKKLKSIKYSLDGMDVELIPASIITYIEERIEAIKSTYKITEDSSNNEGIIELQAVLNKIKELGTK